jgi:hypothetical protein
VLLTVYGVSAVSGLLEGSQDMTPAGGIAVASPVSYLNA